jgi:hypothetical protein
MTTALGLSGATTKTSPISAITAIKARVRELKHRRRLLLKSKVLMYSLFLSGD